MISHTWDGNEGLPASQHCDLHKPSSLVLTQVHIIATSSLREGLTAEMGEREGEMGREREGGGDERGGPGVYLRSRSDSVISVSGDSCLYSSSRSFRIERNSIARSAEKMIRPRP